SSPTRAILLLELSSKLGISGFDICRPSQPLLPIVGLPLKREKRPQKAGFPAIDFRLLAPISPLQAAKLPKVSRRTREYSRFPETAAGDLVRSRLPPEGSSLTGRHYQNTWPRQLIQ